MDKFFDYRFNGSIRSNHQGDDDTQLYGEGCKYRTYEEYLKGTDRKARKIIIDKATVHNDIDSLNFKLTDSALQEMNVRTKNAIASDSTEDYDGMIIARLVDYRDAEVRYFLRNNLKKEEILEISNIPEYDDKYIYNLELYTTTPDVIVKIAMQKIHEYLVKGALLDWYRQCGLQYGESFVPKLMQIEEKLKRSMIPATIRRPMQPFGPAGIM